jgi:hypothetical protein
MFTMLKEWNKNSSLVWREIVSRWGQEAYDDEVTRAAHQITLQAEYDSNQYQRDRATDYPAIADQLDDIFHNGVKGWKATIQLTKDKYPKGGN